MNLGKGSVVTMPLSPVLKALMSRSTGLSIAGTKSVLCFFCPCLEKECSSLPLKAAGSGV